MRAISPQRLSLVAGAALVCSLALVAARAGAAYIAPPPPIWAYPTTPRAVSGGDPLAALGKPVECAPEKDAQGSGNYYPLVDLPQHPGTNPYVPGAPYTTVLAFQNEKQQRFLIYVSAGTQATIGQYIATTSACLEAFKLPMQMPAVVDPVDFTSILLQAAENETQRSQADLATIRDTLAADPDSDGPITLRSVLWNLYVDPDTVLAQAVPAANAALQAKVTSGELSAAEVAALDTGSIMTQLMDEPGVDFLFPPDELPPTPADIGNRLQGDTTGTIVVATAPAAHSLHWKHSVIWFAFDPKISKGKTHDYVTACRRSADAEIRSKAGSERLQLRRFDPETTPESAWVTAGQSKTLVLNDPTVQRYVSFVKGLQDDSDYSLYGSEGWVKGSGNAC
jgi:hypothetical protein